MVGPAPLGELESEYGVRRRRLLGFVVVAVPCCHRPCSRPLPSFATSLSARLSCVRRPVWRSALQPTPQPDHQPPPDLSTQRALARPRRQPPRTDPHPSSRARHQHACVRTGREMRERDSDSRPGGLLCSEIPAHAYTRTVHTSLLCMYLRASGPCWLVVRA